MSIKQDQINDYLDRYADSLSSFDAETAASLWSTPGVIIDDRFSGVIESRDQMVQGLEQSYPLYQNLGLASVGYEVLDENHMTNNLVLVQVQWKFFDEKGELLTDSNAYYLLRVENTELRTVICIQTDDLEKLQALASSQGMDLTPPAE
ncbi:hypothetical protein [Brevibacterium aurantiacum]|uniref:SnoaL-like domain-containing protein n=1 Tax=Brevibacterium aurantiacum TaxID=273384 RepID=A0A556CCH6_BREAU|nr:hypothetical protein [Brevibacterium aurantiacum]TSI15110.1 hypothetical protein FO013_13925 [Brevibacterium aurantiacum]